MIYYLKLITAFTGIAVALSACKKADVNDPITYDSYLPLKVGNYWIYEEFRIDTAGNATTLSKFDSTFIERDTTINNRTYFKLTHTGLTNQWTPAPAYVRDSLHYLVNHKGEILFSSENFTDTLSNYLFVQEYNNNNGLQKDTLAYITTKMEDMNSQTILPAGAFTTSSFLSIYNMFPKYAHNGNPRYLNTRYSKDVGIITETLLFYVNDANSFEKRLIRYHLN